MNLQDQQTGTPSSCSWFPYFLLDIFKLFWWSFNNNKSIKNSFFFFSLNHLSPHQTPWHPHHHNEWRWTFQTNKKIFKNVGAKIGDNDDTDISILNYLFLENWFLDQNVSRISRICKVIGDLTKSPFWVNEWHVQVKILLRLWQFLNWILLSFWKSFQ
jgi:hypothetical protein